MSLNDYLEKRLSGILLLSAAVALLIGIVSLLIMRWAGPALAALWQLQHMAFTPDARSLSVGWLTRIGQEIGFKIEQTTNLIPAMTKLVVLEKPA